MECKGCKWPSPETCKQCKKEKKPADDYGLYYITKISKN